MFQEVAQVGETVESEPGLLDQDLQRDATEIFVSPEQSR